MQCRGNCIVKSMSKFRNYNLLDTLQPCAPKRSSERRVYVYRTMKINSDASLSHKVVEIVEEVVKCPITLARTTALEKAL